MWYVCLACRKGCKSSHEKAARTRFPPWTNMALEGKPFQRELILPYFSGNLVVSVCVCRYMQINVLYVDKTYTYMCVCVCAYPVWSFFHRSLPANTHKKHLITHNLQAQEAGLDISKLSCTSSLLWKGRSSSCLASATRVMIAYIDATQWDSINSAQVQKKIEEES